MELTDYKTIKNLLYMHNFRFTKSLGQNFLTDKTVVQDIVAGAGIDKSTGVIEIGPGIGTMTGALASAAAKVVAIEIDKDLLPILAVTLSEHQNIEIINEDVLKIDLNALIAEKFGDMPVKIVANLPYYITTPIVASLLENKVRVTDIVVMVQKEVALRMAAAHDTSDYGALSVLVQYHCAAGIIRHVSHSCFVPQPKVDSAVVAMRMLDAPSVTVADERKFFRLVKAAFGQRRKTFINAVSNSGKFSTNKQGIAQILADMGIDQRIRGEALSMRQLAEICDAL